MRAGRFVGNLRDIEQRLRSRDPDARKVRAWLTKRARPWLARPDRTAADAELFLLVTAIDSAPPLSAWERAGDRARRQHAAAVTRHARALIDLLERDCRPYYPPAIGLFEEDHAHRIASMFTSELRERVIVGTKFDPRGAQLHHTDDGRPEFLSLADCLASLFCWPKSQSLSAMLAKLESIASAAAAEQGARLPSRPNKGDPDRRALAVHLANHFSGFYGKTPNDVIACCVNLAYPDGDPPATEDLVRGWRGAR